jgi:hypothetical protein
VGKAGFKEKPDLGMFDPKIFISDFSEFLEELLKKFKEEKIDIKQN